LLLGLAPEAEATDPAALKSLAPKVPPKGWVLRDAPEVYTKETLFEHINGQADLFIQYGFQGSVFAIYQNGSSPRDKIDVDIYDMGNVTQAFGVFSRFRNEDRPAGVGLDSCVSDNFAIFYKDRYFVALQAAEPNAAALRELAKMIESGIYRSTPRPKEISYFPRAGLNLRSIEYFPDGLLGRQFLKRGFKATYYSSPVGVAKSNCSDANREFCLFIALFESPQDAEAALEMYRRYLSKEGKAAEVVSGEPASRRITGVDSYQGKTIVALKGSSLVGVLGCEDEKEASAHLSQLIEKME
jgi:hypothetical protein